MFRDEVLPGSLQFVGIREYGWHQNNDVKLHKFVQNRRCWFCENVDRMAVPTRIERKVFGPKNLIAQSAVRINGVKNKSFHCEDNLSSESQAV